MKALAAFLLLAVAVWAQEPTPRQRATSAINDLGRVLQQLLGEEMKQGGYAGAVKSCAENAQLVTEEFSRERGLELRRVSLKYRNLKDQPDEWETLNLKAWAKQMEAGQVAAPVEETVTENGRRFLRVMKPIAMQAVCLGCHGPASQITPEVKAALDAHYPRDKATGYKTGELRGAFSVLVALP
ncbi:Tll0287-like domain-containing protein [Paludibaculum fermentans]|uniref:Tll0287-like domain-containing protein n=1 Tax=Paludibaculum fermentans TaxID=1473598 RepID=UPI003EB71A56